MSTGGRGSTAREVAGRGPGRVMTRDPSSGAGSQFPCANCGALQTYAPGTEVLRCPYCQHETPVMLSSTSIQEYDFRAALAKLATARDKTSAEHAVQTSHCDACGASFTFDQDIHSGECPYCATPVVLTSAHKLFKPKSLLPFKIEQDQARERFQDWLRGLWFAPGNLKQYARADSRLQGVYIPYWTYDSHTRSRYLGERGDYYQVPQQYTAVVNGRRVTRTRMITKVRWSPARGEVARFFDDILVGATESLPRKITDRLEPWDLANLVPYQEQYLSGYTSQIYQVDLDEGFDRARETMDRIIRQDVARDIGGDVQRIHRLETRHRYTTFKHLLLPIWSAGFRYRGKDYLFVVNARTGKVQGERPYSRWKILLALLLGLVLAGGAALLYLQYQAQYPDTALDWTPAADPYRRF